MHLLPTKSKTSARSRTWYDTAITSRSDKSQYKENSLRDTSCIAKYAIIIFRRVLEDKENKWRRFYR
ncbi:hypothetical protein ACH3XW_22300 [Acanthocheilonema viteae]